MYVCMYVYSSLVRFMYEYEVGYVYLILFLNLENRKLRRDGGRIRRYNNNTRQEHSIFFEFSYSDQVVDEVVQVGTGEVRMEDRGKDGRADENRTVGGEEG